jgi:hypothetical protein
MSIKDRRIVADIDYHFWPKFYTGRNLTVGVVMIVSRGVDEGGLLISLPGVAVCRMDTELCPYYPQLLIVRSTVLQ